MRGSTLNPLKRMLALALAVALSATMLLGGVPAGHDESKSDSGVTDAPSGLVGPNVFYLRNAAYGYANQWYGARNPHYNDFTGSGGDCANFVSQCLVAGGISLWQGTDGAGYGVYPDVDRPTSYSNGTMPYCDYLHQHLTKYEPVDYYYVVEGVNDSIPASIQVGDAVIFGNATDHYKHAMLVVWVGAADIGLAAHTTDTWNASYWGVLASTSFSVVNFYHFKAAVGPTYPFVITTGTLNVRVGPGLNGMGSYYQAIGAVHTPEMYVAIGNQTDASGNVWYEFWFDERIAWCAGQMASGNVYVRDANQAEFEINVAASLNVRDGPGTSYAIAGQAFDGTRYVQKGMRNNSSTIWRSFWWGGMVKWCSSSYTFNASGIEKNLTRLNVGFYPSWMGSAYTGLKHDLLSHLAWFSVEMDAAGAISNYNSWPSGWSELVLRCRENGTKVLLTVTLFGSSSVSTFLADPAARAAGIGNLLTLTNDGNADGIMVDFEYPPSGSDANLLAFMEELDAAFYAESMTYEVHLCLMPYPWASYGFGQLPAINDHVDYYFLMGYDYFYGGSGTTGAVGALFWGNNIDAWYSIDRWINVYGADRGKFVYGVPYFGFDWPVNAAQYNVRGATTTGAGSSRTYSSAMTKLESTGASLIWDSLSVSPWFWYNETGVSRQVWFDNATSLLYKYQVVNQLDLPGMGIWALGYDGARTELWGSIDEKCGLFSLDVPSPANGSVVSGTVNMTLLPGGGVTEAWVRVPGGVWQKATYVTDIHSTHVAQYYFVWDTTMAPNGWQTVEFRLNNSYGYISYENRTYDVQNGVSYLPVPLTQGWNLVSLPLVQANSSLQSCLASIAGSYDRTQFYDSSSTINQWRQYYSGWQPALNDLSQLNHSIAFWLNVTAPSATLNVTGTLPSSTAIVLRQGWNMVGYPARNDSSYTVGQLKTATGATIVEGFNGSATYKTSVLPDSRIMKRGEGYWVYAPAPTTWMVDW
ncbi:MAG: amidase domain-containing protein [Euryarchaeota archaeon]|nr:amidase domain-containing protein [Euryarchaeota archaeon]